MRSWEQFETLSLNIDTLLTVMSNFDQTLEVPDLQMWLKSSQLAAVHAKACKADVHSGVLQCVEEENSLFYLHNIEKSGRPNAGPILSQVMCALTFIQNKRRKQQPAHNS